VFSMSGGALAATHYLISSKKQISPKVLKELKGKSGGRGLTGASGPQGPAGPQGAAGAAGAAGTAVAFASVVINGAGNPSFLTNSGFTSVTSPSAGVYCLTPAFAGHPLLVTPAGIEAVFALVSAQNCPGGYQIETNSTVSSGQGFVVAVP
jgi:hypothetical protein